MIKLPRNQVVAANSDCNYCRIRQDDRDYYFFVMSADWRARRTVAFHLSMDTINTWWDELSWNAKTTIQRQHGDRFDKFLTGQSRTRLVRAIDRYNEGINPILNVGFRPDTLRSEVLPDSVLNWYLVYKTKEGMTPDNTTNPISVMLLADESLLINKGGESTSNTLETTFDELTPNNQIVWITEEMVQSGLVGSIDTPMWVTPGLMTFGEAHPSIPGAYLRAVCIDASEPVGWDVRKLYYTGDSPSEYVWTTTEEPWLTYSNRPTVLKNIASFRRGISGGDLTSYADINAVGNEVKISYTNPRQETIPFTQFDRSNSKISKIIKLPYPPIEITSETIEVEVPPSPEFPNGTTTYRELIHFPQGWVFNSIYGAMEYVIAAQDTFSTELQEYSFEDEYVVELDSAPASGNGYLEYSMESKLYNSEFYNVSLMYDNVSHQVKLERLDFGVIPSVKPIFYVPNTMTNNMMFKVEYNGYFNPEYPYGDFLTSTRNNEMTIFSSGYVDYLRNGYNFDREAREQQNRQQIISAGIAVAGAIGSIWTGGASLMASSAAIAAINKSAQGFRQDAINLGALDVSGTPLPVTQHYLDEEGNLEPDTVGLSEQRNAIQNYKNLKSEAERSSRQQSLPNTYAGLQMVQSGINALSSVNNAIQSVAANNRNFQASLAQKQAMAVGAQGSADVDLMSIYAQNRLRVHKYTLHEQDRINLARVFYYTGYAHPLQEIPNWSSRYWFNFVQCTAHFNNEQTCIYHNYINDIKTRLGLGVTVYHEHNGEYDLDQTKENWETWLID